MDTNTDTKKRRTICFWVFFFVVFAVCFRKVHRTSSWDWRCALELASWPTQQRVTRAGRFILTRVRASDRIWSSQDRERLRALTWSRGAARCIYNILSTWSGLHWFKELWGWGIVSPAHFGLNTEYRCRHLEIFGSPLALHSAHLQSVHHVRVMSLVESYEERQCVPQKTSASCCQNHLSFRNIDYL